MVKINREEGKKKAKQNTQKKFSSYNWNSSALDKPKEVGKASSLIAHDLWST